MPPSLVEGRGIADGGYGLLSLFLPLLSRVDVRLWIQNHKRMWFYLEPGCDFRFDLNWVGLI